jgi:transposase-like protein
LARVGRKPQGWNLIDRLSGEKSCKDRLKAFLQTLSGQSKIEEACRDLGLGPSRFFHLRNCWLQEAADLLAPKPTGRPPKKTHPDPQVTQLQAEVRQLKQRLLAAELRAQLAEAGALRAKPAPQKKGIPR